MNKKIGNFFEQYIDKAILGIIGLVCVWLLVTHIVFSPNVISYDNKKFGPGGIDIYISEQAKLLESRLNRKPEPLPPYKRKFDDFFIHLNFPVPNVQIISHQTKKNYLRRPRLLRFLVFGACSSGSVNLLIDSGLILS